MGRGYRALSSEMKRIAEGRGEQMLEMVKASTRFTFNDQLRGRQGDSGNHIGGRFIGTASVLHPRADVLSCLPGRIPPTVGMQVLACRAG